MQLLKLAKIEPRDRYDKILDYITSGWALSDDTSGCNHVVPNIAGLAAYLGVSKPIVMAWCNDDEDIAGLIMGMQAKQESMLIAGGLTKAWDSKIVALMLGKHGYSTQSTIEHAGSVKTESTIDPSLLSDATIQEIISIRAASNQT